MNKELKDCREVINNASKAITFAHDDLSTKLKEMSMEEKNAMFGLDVCFFGTILSIPAVIYFGYTLLGGVWSGSLLDIASLAFSGLGVVSALKAMEFDGKVQNINAQVNYISDKLFTVDRIDSQLSKAKELISEVTEETVDKKYTDGYTDDIIEEFTIENYCDQQLKPKVLSRKL